VHAAVQNAVEAGLVASAHDCAEGGIAVALAECCVTGAQRVGAEVALPAGARRDQVLFGEGPSRVVVSVEPGRERAFEALMAESAIPWRWIGITGGDRLRATVDGGEAIDAPLEHLAQAWRSGFERHMA
jgi:phosphoribosylformylglycinamidine (FGAM) synthase-like enzyme